MKEMNYTKPEIYISYFEDIYTSSDNTQTASIPVTYDAYLPYNKLIVNAETSEIMSFNQ